MFRENSNISLSKLSVKTAISDFGKTPNLGLPIIKQVHHTETERNQILTLGKARKKQNSDNKKKKILSFTHSFFLIFFSESGVCTSYGDPHYQTFDRQMFNFHGTCRYQLTSDCVSDQFTIRMRNERRYSNVYAWSKALTIHMGDSVIVLHKDLQVKVNKTTVDLPYYHLPYFQIIKGSFTITLVSQIGLQVSACHFFPVTNKTTTMICLHLQALCWINSSWV